MWYVGRRQASSTCADMLMTSAVDMHTQYMKQVVEENPSQVMSAEARNLFSVAYKNVVGARRSAWRVVNSLVEKAGEDNKIGKEYKERIEKELKKECEEVLVSQHCITT